MTIDNAYISTSTISKVLDLINKRYDITSNHCLATSFPLNYTYLEFDLKACSNEETVMYLFLDNNNYIEKIPMVLHLHSFLYTYQPSKVVVLCESAEILEEILTVFCTAHESLHHQLHFMTYSRYLSNNKLSL